MKKHVTLQDIANKLNISKVSVSKALRDHPDISTLTKQRITATAQKMGYMPNFIARNLSSRQSNTIGLVVPKIAHHFFASAIEAIYQTAYMNNYEIIMTVSQENAEHEAKHIQTLLSMHVDGLLVSVTEQTKDNTIFDLVKKRGTPLVFFDRVVEGLGFSTVTNDDEKGTYLAIKKIIEAGYTKIAHLAGYGHSNIGYNRRKGFESAAKEGKLKIPNDWIIEGGFAEQDGYDGFMSIQKSANLPEVIFAVTYPVALGIQLAAQETGIKIPDQLEIISFGGSIYNRFGSPSITYIDQPIKELGARAIQLVIDEIKNPDTAQEQHITLPTELIVCETCKKIIGN
ncbi:MAG: LacI family DNA-binding transcriptional regulator [Calditrichaceae bacterium]|nr:LacI family DNA-binding transcriptional regulator [Calditrichaceae bacterium]